MIIYIIVILASNIANDCKDNDIHNSKAYNLKNINRDRANLGETSTWLFKSEAFL